MNGNRMPVGLIAAAALVFAACGVEEEAPDAVLTDTITQPGTATVQVPVTDTAVIQREISIDTTVDVDRTVLEAEATGSVQDTAPR